MCNKLTCEQIKSILELYIKDSLNKVLKKLVKTHLENCEYYMAEYINLMEKVHSTKCKPESHKDYTKENKQYSDFRKNLSAYIDNELSNEENIRIKKFAISNQTARKDLENLFLFKKFLHSSFEKTKDELKTDYSKIVSNIIKQQAKHERTIIPFYKIAALLTILLGFLVCCLLTTLYFQ